MNVQVRVCERGALSNGRFAFTDKFTLITELIQNARRANASYVSVQYADDTKELTVIDDGCGIKDFQKLLTFNETGWSAQTIEAETPFGVGFSKCLYAAKRVSIKSRGYRLEFDCATALAQEPLTVVRDTRSSVLLTVIRLEGVDLQGLENRIQRLVRGFPIPVVFNGTELPRNHALKALPFRPCAIGHVFLSQLHSKAPSTGTAMYLQGLLIGHADYYCDNSQVDVIHLDPKQFLARLPDRKELIDAAEQQHVIAKAVSGLWREVLLQRKDGEPDPLYFAEFCFRIARSTGHVDLFDDVPLVPRQVCTQVSDYPILDQDQDFREPMRHHVEREAVERGEIMLAEVDLLDEETLPRWLYARARGLVIVETAALGEAHWVHDRVRKLSDEAFTVTARGETHSAEFDGRWVCPTVKFCEAVVITHGTDTIELVDSPVYHDDVVYYPAGATGGEVVRQIARYEDEHEHFDEDDCIADTEAFADFVRLMRSTDPIGTLRSLMSELSLERYPLLSGRTFRIAVGQAASSHSVELVD